MHTDNETVLRGGGRDIERAPARACDGQRSILAGIDTVYSSHSLLSGVLSIAIRHQATYTATIFRQVCYL